MVDALAADAELVAELSPTWWSDPQLRPIDVLRPFLERGFHVYLLPNDYSVWRYLWPRDVGAPQRFRTAVWSGAERGSTLCSHAATPMRCDVDLGIWQPGVDHPDSPFADQLGAQDFPAFDDERLPVPSKLDEGRQLPPGMAGKEFQLCPALAGQLCGRPTEVVVESDDHPVLEPWQQEFEHRHCAGIQIAVDVGKGISVGALGLILYGAKGDLGV